MFFLLAHDCGRFILFCLAWWNSVISYQWFTRNSPLPIVLNISNGIGAYTVLYFGSYWEINSCLMTFHTLAPESKQKAVYRKYSNPKLGAVSLYSPAKKLLSVWAEAPCCGGCFCCSPFLLSLWRCCYCYCVSSFWWYHFVSVLFSALCFDQYT